MSADHSGTYVFKPRLLDIGALSEQGGLVNTTEPDRRRFGRLVAELRRNRNVSQQQVGDALGVTPQTVSGWELGEWMPADKKMASALDRFLNADGRILEALGYSIKPSVDARLSEIEERLDKLTSQLERLARRLRRGTS